MDFVDSIKCPLNMSFVPRPSFRFYIAKTRPGNETISIYKSTNLSLKILNYPIIIDYALPSLGKICL